jgi:hypothetical protein
VCCKKVVLTSTSAMLTLDTATMVRHSTTRLSPVTATIGFYSTHRTKQNPSQPLWPRQATCHGINDPGSAEISGVSHPTILTTRIPPQSSHSLDCRHPCFVVETVLLAIVDLCRPRKTDTRSCISSYHPDKFPASPFVGRFPRLSRPFPSCDRPSTTY